MAKSSFWTLIIGALFLVQPIWAAKTEYLVKFKPGIRPSLNSLSTLGIFNSAKSTKIEHLYGGWALVEGTQTKGKGLETLLNSLDDRSNIEWIQPNYPIHLYEDFQIQDRLKRAIFAKGFAKIGRRPIPKVDNPPIPLSVDNPAEGPDLLIKNQWGLNDIGAPDVWNVTKGSPEMIVAVIDTGVDYTHEDLVPNLWRNPGELPDNGIDDDKNGFIDDVIGWDFAANDNKPYDLAVEGFELMTKGGNPGHGTHCAGNIAARGNNGLGISGVSPNVKIMSLRSIGDKGSGTTADAIRAIKYAVDNGAKILSNSWGSEGEDPKEAADNKALQEIIHFAKDKDVLFIAAAGNGHNGKGYDNDTDASPAFPATYDIENIVSVAAVDSKDRLAGFSNWGAKSVHLAAPGVKIFSTTVGSNYSDIVFGFAGFGIGWDGTSMATPHVAGAAALYWSAHPNKTALEVKEALIQSARAIPALEGKTVSGGKLDVKELMK